MQTPTRQLHNSNGMHGLEHGTGGAQETHSVHEPIEPVLFSTGGICSEDAQPTDARAFQNLWSLFEAFATEEHGDRTAQIKTYFLSPFRMKNYAFARAVTLSSDSSTWRHT